MQRQTLINAGLCRPHQQRSDVAVSAVWIIRLYRGFYEWGQSFTRYAKV